MAFKITCNKILFIISAIFDIFFFYQYFNYSLILWKFILPIMIIPITALKYFHFCVCFTFINRKNVNMALISIFFSTIFKIFFMIILYLKFMWGKLMIMSIFFSIDLVIVAYFAISIYFMKGLLYFDVSIPVDGYGINEKIDKWGNAIPGL